MSGEVLMNAGEGGVVHVTLRHTGRLNAMSRPMWRQLRAVFEDVQRRADARCVLIACLSSMIGIAFAFGVEYVWYYPRTFFTWFILAGIAVAAMRMSDEADAQTAVAES